VTASRIYAALVILLDRMQRVQTRILFVAPFTTARTLWMFGSNRRGRTLWAWDTRRPTAGPLPQTSHRMAMSDSLLRKPLL
jgi:hypothetical protein